MTLIHIVGCRSQTRTRQSLSCHLSDGANGHPLRVHVSRDHNIFAATGARSQWPSLILFSLDEFADASQAPRLKMNDQQKKEQYSGVRDQEIRAALDQHWAASDANDFETEHLIYREDAVLEYPQSGERTRGRCNIQNQRASQPSKKRFAVRRIIGSGDLWVTEFILTYDGKPSYTVSIMEFKGDKVARETQYFADPFVAPAWRAQWVERMDT
jgi:hypothetical protein